MVLLSHASDSRLSWLSEMKKISRRIEGEYPSYFINLQLMNDNIFQHSPDCSARNDKQRNDVTISDTQQPIVTPLYGPK